MYRQNRFFYSCITKLEMSTLVALQEDPSSILCTHMAVHSGHSSSFMGSNNLSGPQGHLAHKLYTDIYAGKTTIHIHFLTNSLKRNVNTKSKQHFVLIWLGRVRCDWYGHRERSPYMVIKEQSLWKATDVQHISHPWEGVSR